MKTMRLVRRDKAQPFVCDRCRRAKKAKIIWHTAMGVICNGCHGKILAKQG